MAAQVQRCTFWPLTDLSGLGTGLVLMAPEAGIYPKWSAELAPTVAQRETLTSSMLRKQHSMATDWVTSFAGNATAAKAQGQRAAQ